MKEKIQNAFAVIGIAFVLTFALVALTTGKLSQSVGSSLTPTTYVTASSSVSSVTSASTVVAATSTSRQYLRITSPLPISCSANSGTAAVANTGIKLSSTTDTVIFSADTDNLYTGTVNCISPVATAIVSVYQR